jgi:hypothetical protein
MLKKEEWIKMFEAVGFKYIEFSNEYKYKNYFLLKKENKA